ncbi:hypothetical protein ACFV23_04810 [Streptomyces sp. NPDC059627]
MDMISGWRREEWAWSVRSSRLWRWLVPWVLGEELLFVLAVMGDDRAVRATYVVGELAHDRDTAPT